MAWSLYIALLIVVVGIGAGQIPTEARAPAHRLDLRPCGNRLQTSVALFRGVALLELPVTLHAALDVDHLAGYGMVGVAVRRELLPHGVCHYPSYSQCLLTAYI